MPAAQRAARRRSDRPRGAGLRRSSAGRARPCPAAQRAGGSARETRRRRRRRRARRSGARAAARRDDARARVPRSARSRRATTRRGERADPGDRRSRARRRRRAGRRPAGVPVTQQIARLERHHLARVGDERRARRRSCREVTPRWRSSPFTRQVIESACGSRPGDDDGADGAEGVHALGAGPLAVLLLEIARGDVARRG